MGLKISCKNCGNGIIVNKESIQHDKERVKRNQVHKDKFSQELELYKSMILERAIMYCSIVNEKYLTRNSWFFKEWKPKYTFSAYCGSIYNNQMSIHHSKPFYKPYIKTTKEYFIVCDVCDKIIYLEWSPVIQNGD